MAHLINTNTGTLHRIVIVYSVLAGPAPSRGPSRIVPVDATRRTRTPSGVESCSETERERDPAGEGCVSTTGRAEMPGEHVKAQWVKNLADPSKDTPEIAARRAEILAKLAAAQALQNGIKPSGSGGLQDSKVNIMAPSAQATPAKSKIEKVKNLADPSKDSPGTAAKRAEIMAKVAAAKSESKPAPAAKKAKQTKAVAATDIEQAPPTVQPTPAKSKIEKVKNLADPSKDSPGTAAKRAEIMAKVAAAKAASVSASNASAMSVGAYVTAQGQLQDLVARTGKLEQSEENPTDEELRALRAACASLRSSVTAQLQR